MSFRLRVFLLVMLVAVPAIGATAFLTLRLASQGYSREQHADQQHRADIVTKLAAYGLTHGQWGGVATLASSLSHATDLRIRLTTVDGVVLVDTDNLAGRAARQVSPLPSLVDPRPALDPSLDPSLAPPSGPSGTPELYGKFGLFDTPAHNLILARKVPLASLAALQLLQYRAALLVVRCAARTAGGPAVLTTTDAPYLSPDQIQANPDCVQQATNQVETDNTTIAADRAALDACVVNGPDMACLSTAFTTRIGNFTAAPLQLSLGAATDEPFGQLGRPALIGSIGLLLVAVVGTAVVARRVSRPVRRLTAASQRLAAGELDVSVPIDGSDELARLSQSFNRMAGALQRSEERQRRLVADVAHELRTPLSNLRGYLEGLQDGIVPPTREVFASLHEEAMLQWRILQDLQVLALAEAGGLAYAPVAVDLAELSVERTGAHRANAEATLTVDAPGPVWVIVDPDRIRQVLGNLLTNAIRHTPAGGEVRVRVHQDGRTAVLQVMDTGCGIAPGDLPRVFDRFWRADPTRQRATGGTGLGLTITHRIVTDHGGTIDVESQVGVGTVFTVRLPLS